MDTGTFRVLGGVNGTPKRTPCYDLHTAVPGSRLSFSIRTLRESRYSLLFSLIDPQLSPPRWKASKNILIVF